MNYQHLASRQLEQRLAFLAEFLEDDNVRVIESNPTKFSGPCAGFTFPRLAVSDFAAMGLASLLKLPEEPKPNWSKDDWARLRAKVRKELDRRAADKARK